MTLPSTTATVGTDTPIRIGVVGLGWFGTMMAEQFAANPNVRITNVCDRDPARSSELAAEYGIASHTDHRALLDSEALDAVYVAAPPSQHRQIVLDAIDRKVHVLCEKPLVPTGDDAAQLHAAAVGSGVVTAVNFPLQYASVGVGWRQRRSERFEGSLTCIEILIRCPLWPRPYQNVAWVGSRQEGGPIMEIGTHFVQLIRSLYGELRIVDAHVRWPNDSDRSEQWALARMELSDGTPVVMRVVCGVGGDESVSITCDGENGSLAMLEWGQLSEARPGTPFRTSNEFQPSSVIDEFCSVVRWGHGSIVDFAEAHAVQTVVDGLRQGT